MSSLQPTAANTSNQRWPWWPLLPLYPYGRRPTLVRELVPNRVCCFEQLHGVWYVAVPSATPTSIRSIDRQTAIAGADGPIQ